METEQKQYELICILNPFLEEVDLNNFKADLEKIITNHNGQIVHFMEPEKRDLAYPINKQNQGIYLISHITLEPQNVIDFLKELKTLKSLLRHLISALESPNESSVEKSGVKKQKIRKTIFTKTAESKDDKMDLEEIDKKLDELVGI